MALPSEFHLTVAFPAAGGFLGRQCDGPACGRYFKVHTDCLAAAMHCPYCGESFPNDKLWTNDQVDLIRETVAHEITPQVVDHIRDTFRQAFSGKSGWTFKPGGPTPRPPAPRPHPDKSVDSELKCSGCGVRFQVDGIFGYCPGCRSENLRLYDANLEIIRREIAQSSNPKRYLRHAYADLVSTFEIFCRKEALTRGVASGRFQNLRASRELFLATLHVDILADIPTEQELSLRRVFQKRHITEHAGGTIDARYVGEVPEDAALLGQKAVLSLGELELAGKGIRHALDVLVRSRQ